MMKYLGPFEVLHTDSFAALSRCLDGSLAIMVQGTLVSTAFAMGYR